MQLVTLNKSKTRMEIIEQNWQSGMKTSRKPQIHKHSKTILDIDLQLQRVSYIHPAWSPSVPWQQQLYALAPLHLAVKHLWFISNTTLKTHQSSQAMKALLDRKHQDNFFICPKQCFWSRTSGHYEICNIYFYFLPFPLISRAICQILGNKSLQLLWICFLSVLCFEKQTKLPLNHKV